MLAKYKFQNTALPMSQIILVNFERLRYTSCNIVNVDHNKNKKRKHCPRMRKRDCNPPLRILFFKFVLIFAIAQNENKNKLFSWIFIKLNSLSAKSSN